MARIVVSENVSLDGVAQVTAGEEGFRHDGWVTAITEADRAAWAGLMLSEALGAEALLLGRRTEAWFAERWLARTGEWADRLNGMPKYVVSSTLDEPRWGNSTVLRGDALNEVAKLKQELDGDIVSYGSTQLVRLLMAHDLVDELRLTVYPVVLGSGQRLFGEADDKQSLRLASTRTLGDGLAYLTYESVRPGPVPR